MCGINAIMRSTGRVTDTMLNAMSRKTEHRGPDSFGSFISKDKKIGLVHNRLSIIDLSKRSNQPMFDANKRLTIVFNGEIYNYKQLSEELSAKGHTFETKSDTEVILEAYKEFGVGCVSHLDGMFAFVIYDTLDNTLFIARDRMGEKPLVYCGGDGYFVVSSEIPALLSTGLIKKEINKEALGHYFLRNLYNVPDPLTIFKGVYKLKAAHYMIIKDCKIIRYERYWRPSFKKIKRNNELDEFRKTLSAAVESRTISDVPISVLLSGGVDSSSVVALIKERNVRSYSFGADSNDEELKRAKEAASRFNTSHKEVIIRPNQLKIIGDLISIYGEPIYLLPLSYAYSIANEIRKDGVKVALTGNGADELLFGYDGSNRLMFISYLFKLTDLLPRGLFSFISRFFSGENKTVLSMMSVDMTKRKGEAYRLESKQLLPNLLSSPSYNELKNVDFGSLIDEASAICDSEWYIDYAYWCGLILENSHSITISGDLPAMYHAVEFRSPFLDHKLAEFSFSLHPSKKVGSLFDKSKNKLILKKVMENTLPKHLLYAKKMGFGYNISPRDRIRGEWKNEIEEKVLHGRYLSSGIFNLKYISQLMGDHMGGKKDNTKLILALYAFDLWYERFMV